MKIGVSVAILFLIFAMSLSSCIVVSPYDRQYPPRPHPHAMMHRPHAVRGHAWPSPVWHPYGMSSYHHREHWQRHHGSYYNRTKVWPNRYVVKTRYQKSRLGR